MEENSENPQPYRATRLWNEVIHAFQTGMPVKQHRHRIRKYNNCFTASDCVSWLNLYLKTDPHFGPHVTRQQTVQLLEKFLKCHVMESVTGKSDFKDNSNLYRFVDYKNSAQNRSLCNSRSPFRILSGNTIAVVCETAKNEPKLTKVTSCDKFDADEGISNVSKSCNVPECHIIERKLSVKEVEAIWKSCALNRLETLLGLTNSGDYFDENEPLGKLIMHNATKISKSGVVMLIDKAEDVPHWVISAMKCLAYWPDASGSSSCLPNYPGFERDVFNVVKDFFLNPRIPLVLPNLFALILKAFCKFGKVKPESLLFHDSLLLQCNRKTSTPISTHEKQNDVMKFAECIQSVEGRILLEDSAIMWEYPLSMCYETEFATVCPVTRVVPNYTLHTGSKQSLSSLSTVDRCDSKAIETSSTISACSKATANRKLSKSLDNLKDLDDLNRTFRCYSLGHLIDDNFSTPKSSDPYCETRNLRDYNQRSSPSGSNSGVKDDALKKLTESLQLILLFLPISNRRHLHLLLRMISKILKNNKLQLGNHNIQIKDHLIQTFAPAIVKFDEDLPHSRDLVMEVLTFLVNECEEILIPPFSLKDDAFTKLANLQRHRIKYTLDDSSPFTYCEIISKQQYQEQTFATSKQALVDLLERILSDYNMTEKNKRRMLKQFKTNHYDIYHERFPFPEDEEKIFLKHPYPILHKFLSLRM